MTDQKNKKIDLREKFMALDEADQKRVTNFFNLHNAAAFCYDQMSEDAKIYCSYCVQLSQEQKQEESHEN